MTNRTNSFRHLIDAIKRTPEQAQNYVDEYCAHEGVTGIVFVQKNGIFSLSWFRTETHATLLHKKIATVLPTVQYIVLASENDLKELGVAKMNFKMNELAERARIAADIARDEAEADNDSTDDDDYDSYDDEENDKHESMCADCNEENCEGREVPYVKSEVNQAKLVELLTKLAKKVKKLNRKFKEHIG